jgi:uncharacterized membrane protein
VDTASLYLERREVQAAVDLASIAAARDPSRAEEIARQTLVDAGVLSAALPLGGFDDLDGVQQLAVATGRYEADASLPADRRFVAGRRPFNAVEVSFRRRGQVFFAQWTAAPAISASATATVTPRVSFSVGSRLARLEGGIANAALNQLLGTGLSLTLLDYRALAAANLHMLDFLDALATEIGITAVTYDDVLEATATRGQLAAALARVLPAAEAHLVQLISNAAPVGPGSRIGRLVELGDLAAIAVGGRPQGLDAGVSALDLLVAGAALGGTAQVSLGIGADVPGLLGITATLVVGEPPQFASFALGPEGSTVRTAQVRLRLAASLLGTPLLLGAGVSVPVHVELAFAEASVAAASCPTPSAPHGTATIAARPGIARLSIGEIGAAAFADFGQPMALTDATLVDAILIGVTGAARVEIAPPSPVNLSFSSAEIAARTAKTAATTTIADSLVASLLGELQIAVRPFGLSAAAIRNALLALLAPATPVLDAALEDLLDALGLGLGEADVRVYGVACAYPVLVG